MAVDSCTNHGVVITTLQEEAHNHRLIVELGNGQRCLAGSLVSPLLCLFLGNLAGVGGNTEGMRGSSTAAGTGSMLGGTRTLLGIAVGQRVRLGNQFINFLIQLSIGLIAASVGTLNIQSTHNGTGQSTGLTAIPGIFRNFVQPRADFHQ